MTSCMTCTTLRTVASKNSLPCKKDGWSSLFNFSIPAHAYTCTHTHTHTHMHYYTHAYVHTHIHTYMHILIYTHTHTHAYVHTLSDWTSLAVCEAELVHDLLDPDEEEPCDDEDDSNGRSATVKYSAAIVPAVDTKEKANSLIPRPTTPTWVHSQVGPGSEAILIFSSWRV